MTYTFMGTGETQQISDAALRSVLDGIRDGVLVFDAGSGEILYANPWICAALGHAAGKLSGRTIDELDPNGEFAASLASGAEWIEHFPLVGRDGGMLACDISLSRVTLAGRLCLAAVFRDVRQRESARASEENERLQVLNRVTNEGVWDRDLITGRSYISTRWKEILGYADDELPDSAESFLFLIHPDDHAAVANLASRQQTGTDSFEVELRLRHRDGTWRWVLSRGGTVRNSAGQVTRVVGAIADIAARKQTEIELRFKEAAIACSLAAIGLTGLDGKYTYVNPAWLKLHGYESVSELEGKSPVDHSADAEAIIHSVQTAGFWTGELQRRRRDGSVFPAEGTFHKLTSTDGEFLGMAGSFQDISERRKNEEALLAERDRLRQILDCQSGFVTVMRPDGRIVEANRSFLKMTGGERAHLSGQEFFEGAWLDENTKGEVCEAVCRAALGETVPIGITARMPGEDRRILHSVFSPLLDADGRVVDIISSGVDVTESRIAEESLRRSAALLREAETVAQLGSWELDLRTGSLMWSEETFRIFEIDPAQFGASYDAFLQLVHPDDREEVDRVCKSSAEQGQPYDFRHRLLMPDGRIKYLRARGRSDYGEDGSPVRTVGTVQDVTLLAEAENRIRKQLEEKEVLLREIHHRVKNNLQIVSSLLSLQAADGNDPDVVSLFEDSQRRIRAMALVHETLYRSSDLSATRIDVYLRKLIDALVSTLNTKTTEVTLELSVTDLCLAIEQAIPCGLIVTELVSNAFKYAFPDRREGRVFVSLQPSGPRHLRLGVRDDGAGVPVEEIRGNFGLKLAGLLAEQLGGKLQISRNEGLELSVDFPVSQ